MGAKLEDTPSPHIMDKYEVNLSREKPSINESPPLSFSPLCVQKRSLFLP